MMKENKFKIILSTVITLLPLVIGLVLWDILPEKMATNFGINGEVTGYSSKEFTVFGLPLIMAFANIICIIATNADPRKKHIDSKAFSVVIGIVPACTLVCSGCIYAAALGYNVKVESIMPVFIGALIFIVGFTLPACKQNYTVGIKLPWTLYDEENWDKTHKMAGKLWVFGGAAMILAGLFNLVVLFVISLLTIVIVPTLYSYLLYKKNK